LLWAFALPNHRQDKAKAIAGSFWSVFLQFMKKVKRMEKAFSDLD